MTSARPRTRAAGAVSAAATVALGLSLVAAPAAQALPASPVILFADGNHSYSLYAGDATGAAATQVTTGGLVTNFVEASHDGQVLAIQAETGTDTTPLFDTTDGLLVSDQGVTHVLATHTQANPVVALDGSKVWFAAQGNLFAWTRSSGTVTALTSNAPLAGTSTQSLWGLAVSSDGSTAAGVFRAASFATDPPTATASHVTAFTVAPTSSTIWTKAYTGAGNPELFSDSPRFAGSTLVFAECATGACDDWKYVTVDTTATVPAPVVTSGELDNTYDLRFLDDGTSTGVGTWYAWGDGAVAGTAVAKTSPDLVAWTPGATRTDAVTSVGFVPVDTAPAAFSARQASTPTASVKPYLVLSSALVKTGGRPVFASYGYYLRPVGTQSWAADSGVTQRGVVTFSTDAGKTWHPLGATTSQTVIAWPGGGPDGNGRTQALTRNTWFRWTVPTDVFVGTATSAVRLVRVTPTVKASVVKSGSKRTVAGSAARIGGTAVLYKGTKKIATEKLSAKGAYSFGKRTLSRGTYRVVTLADASWAAGSLTVKI